jgi:16S rRNA (cytosine967-C5)-methyltransferase
LAAIASARELALDTLCKVEERGAYADLVLGAHLNRARLNAADQALATKLVYGTLAWQGRLDWHLARLCDREPDQLDPWLRVILRLGLYQIMFLDRVPAYAAVHTSVGLARRIKGGAATGLVNATLRRAATDPEALTLPAAGKDPVLAMALRWSHPPWLVARWREDLGDAEVAALVRADQEPAPTVLRTNRLRTDRATLIKSALGGAGLRDARATKYSPVGVQIEAPLRATTAIPEGWATIQSEASQLVSYLVAPRAGERLLDVCAAPGGKATHLAALMQNRGEILAVDVNERGLGEVRKRARQLGVSIIRTLRADARRLATERRVTTPARRGLFDRVLVDAPCSGLGTLRSHPELRWRVRPDTVRGLADLQAEILGGVAAFCAPGGVLVYATCTISHAENDSVIERFCSEHPDFQLDDPRDELPTSIQPLIDSRGVLRTFPHRHGLDGFFAARLRRCEAVAASTRGQAGRPRRRRRVPG